MSKSSNDLDLKIASVLGEISQANRQLSISLDNLNDNLKIMNDQNILHGEKVAREHEAFTKSLEQMDKKYWVALIVMLAIVLLVLGYKEAIKLLI